MVLWVMWKSGCMIIAASNGIPDERRFDMYVFASACLAACSTFLAFVIYIAILEVMSFIMSKMDSSDELSPADRLTVPSPRCQSEANAIRNLPPSTSQLHHKLSREGHAGQKRQSVHPNTQHATSAAIAASQSGASASCLYHVSRLYLFGCSRHGHIFLLLMQKLEHVDIEAASTTSLTTLPSCLEPCSWPLY